MTASLAWPLDISYFMSKVEPHSRMYMMGKDLVTLEGQARGALSVLSNLDALVSAVQSVVQGTSVQACGVYRDSGRTWHRKISGKASCYAVYTLAAEKPATYVTITFFIATDGELLAPSLSMLFVQDR